MAEEGKGTNCGGILNEVESQRSVKKLTKWRGLGKGNQGVLIKQRVVRCNWNLLRQKKGNEREI